MTGCVKKKDLFIPYFMVFIILSENAISDQIPKLFNETIVCYDS